MLGEKDFFSKPSKVLHLTTSEIATESLNKSFRVRALLREKASIFTNIYHAAEVGEEGQESEGEDEEWEYTDETGQIFLMRPKKKTKGKNAPGAAETARRGALANFRNYPNKHVSMKGKSKGKGPCLRCGDPNHWHRDCPLHWKESLDPRHTQKGRSKGKGKAQPILLAENIPTIPEENPIEVEGPNPHPTSEVVAEAGNPLGEPEFSLRKKWMLGGVNIISMTAINQFWCVQR